MRAHLVTIVMAGCAMCTGCKDPKGVDVDPRTLIPEEATLALGFEVAPLRTSAVGSALHRAMQTEPDLAGMVTAIEKCELDVDKMRGLLAGTMADDRFYAALEAPGVGEEKVVRCLEDEIAKAAGDNSGIILFETKGKVRVTPQEGGGYMIILNKDAIALVDEPWEDAVFAAIEDESTRDTESPLAKTVAGMEAHSDLWFAYALSDADRVDLADVPGADQLQLLGMECDFSSGLGLDATFDFEDGAKAKAFADGVAPLLQQAGPALPQMGLPPTLLDSVKPIVDGSTVTAHLQISPANFPEVVETLGALMAE